MPEAGRLGPPSAPRVAKGIHYMEGEGRCFTLSEGAGVKGVVGGTIYKSQG